MPCAMWNIFCTVTALSFVICMTGLCRRETAADANLLVRLMTTLIREDLFSCRSRNHVGASPTEEITVHSQKVSVAAISLCEEPLRHESSVCLTVQVDNRQVLTAITVLGENVHTEWSTEVWARRTADNCQDLNQFLVQNHGN